MKIWAENSNLESTCSASARPTSHLAPILYVTKCTSRDTRIDHKERRRKQNRNPRQGRDKQKTTETCSTIKTSSLLFSQLLDSIQRENMSRLKQPPNDLPVAPQGEGTSNLFGRYYTLPSPPQETRELKTVNSGTNQGKFTEIQSKEEKKEEEQTTTKQKNKRKSSPRTYNLKAAVSGSRLPTGDSNNVRGRTAGKMSSSQNSRHIAIQSQRWLRGGFWKLQIELDFSGTVYDGRLLVVSFASKRAA